MVIKHFKLNFGKTINCAIKLDGCCHKTLISLVFRQMDLYITKCQICCVTCFHGPCCWRCDVVAASENLVAAPCAMQYELDRAERTSTADPSGGQRDLSNDDGDRGVCLIGEQLVKACGELGGALHAKWWCLRCRHENFTCLSGASCAQCQFKTSNNTLMIKLTTADQRRHAMQPDTGQGQGSGLMLQPDQLWQVCKVQHPLRATPCGNWQDVNPCHKCKLMACSMCVTYSPLGARLCWTCQGKWECDDRSQWKVTRPWPPPRDVANDDLCPNPVCTFPKGGPTTDGYCCRRCLHDHDAGTPLAIDPIHGYFWKQRHGPSCTGRAQAPGCEEVQAAASEQGMASVREQNDLVPLPWPSFAEHMSMSREMERERSVTCVCEP